jgi:NAD-dependent deacetylase
LHGELFKARSTTDPTLIYDIEGWELKTGDLCEKGSQLRPHIVWFGEMVPMMDVALKETIQADIFMVVGTSLQVYPAAGLLEYVPAKVPKFIVDPKMPEVPTKPNLFLIEDKASIGVSTAKKMILEMEKQNP